MKKYRVWFFILLVNLFFFAGCITWSGISSARNSEASRELLDEYNGLSEKIEADYKAGIIDLADYLKGKDAIDKAKTQAENSSGKFSFWELLAGTAINLFLLKYRHSAVGYYDEKDKTYKKGLI